MGKLSSHSRFILQQLLRTAKQMPVQLSSFFLFPCNLSMAPIWLQLKGVIVGIVRFVSDPGQCGSTNDNAVCRCVLGADAH